jgi:hypothetical protein
MSLFRPIELVQTGDSLVRVVSVDVDARGDLLVVLGAPSESVVVRVGNEDGAVRVLARVQAPAARVRALRDGFGVVTENAVYVGDDDGVARIDLPAPMHAWAIAADEVYAVARDAVHWFDGRHWRAIALESPGYVGGDGVDGYNVVVGCYGTHSCMMEGRYDRWTSTGCGSWYLYDAHVFSEDRALVVGGDGVWQRHGSGWDSLVERDRLDWHQLAFVGTTDGGSVLGRFVPREPLALWLWRGGSESELTLTGCDASARLEDQPRNRQEAFVRSWPRHLAAWWLRGDRVAVAEGARLWVSSPIAPTELAPDVDDDAFVDFAPETRIARAAVTRREFERFLAATGLAPPPLCPPTRSGRTASPPCPREPSRSGSGRRRRAGRASSCAAGASAIARSSPTPTPTTRAGRTLRPSTSAFAASTMNAPIPAERRRRRRPKRRVPPTRPARRGDSTNRRGGRASAVHGAGGGGTQKPQHSSVHVVPLLQPGFGRQTSTALHARPLVQSASLVHSGTGGSFGAQIAVPSRWASQCVVAVQRVYRHGSVWQLALPTSSTTQTVPMSQRTVEHASMPNGTQMPSGAGSGMSQPGSVGSHGGGRTLGRSQKASGPQSRSLVQITTAFSQRPTAIGSHGWQVIVPSGSVSHAGCSQPTA